MTLTLSHRVSRRLLTALVAVVLAAGLLTAIPSPHAEAVPIYVPISGVKDKGKFYIRGNIGPGYSKGLIKVERQARPGAKWKKYRKLRANRKGIYRVRVSRVAGSRSTCFRIRTYPYGQYDAGMSGAKCLVRVG
jgi:hypothetical protein